MFGYVRPLSGELKVSEYNYYKAAYCAVCREMGKECGAASRLCLSYDAAFLCLLLNAVSGVKSVPEKKHCAVNPLGRVYMLPPATHISYAAAVGGVLAAYGFRDGKKDEKGLRYTAAALASAASSPWIKKVKCKYPGLCEGIEKCLEELYEAEKEAADSGKASADALAGKSGELLAFVCSYPFSEKDGDTERRRVICNSVGKHVGRWIYCIDALDDLKKDAEKGRFNPFLLTYGKSEFTDDEKLTLKCLLSGEAGAALDALELCDNYPEGSPEPLNIVKNILALGMPDAAARVISGTYKKPGHADI